MLVKNIQRKRMLFLFLKSFIDQILNNWFLGYHKAKKRATVSEDSTANPVHQQTGDNEVDQLLEPEDGNENEVDQLLEPENQNDNEIDQLLLELEKKTNVEEFEELERRILLGLKKGAIFFFFFKESINYI